MTSTRTTRLPVMQTERRLLLFDIDGTLITSGGAGEGALKDAMKGRFGVEEDLQGILLAGATDAKIARELLAKPPTGCCRRRQSVVGPGQREL